MEFQYFTPNTDDNRRPSRISLYSARKILARSMDDLLVVDSVVTGFSDIQALRFRQGESPRSWLGVWRPDCLLGLLKEATTRRKEGRSSIILPYEPRIG
jgi:hypothetical protein